MYSVKKLTLEQEFRDYEDIIANAYPGFRVDSSDEKPICLARF